MDPYYLMTFDQQIALNRRQLPFITPVHPLARLAIEYWANPGEPLVSFLRIINDDHETGKYLFIVDLWETIGIRSEISLRGFAWNFTKSRFSPEVSDSLLKLLTRSEGSQEEASSNDIEDIFQKLDEEASQSRLFALQELEKQNDLLANRKIASLDIYFLNSDQPGSSRTGNRSG